jgi:hypothetical protein
MWRRGRDSNPRKVLPFTRFPGVRLKPLIHLSGTRNCSGVHALRAGAEPHQAAGRLACTIFMAELISVETWVMSLGTTSVVVASAATLL